MVAPLAALIAATSAAPVLAGATSESRTPGVTYDDGSGGVYTPEDGWSLLDLFGLRKRAQQPQAESDVQRLAKLPVGMNTPDAPAAPVAKPGFSGTAANIARRSGDPSFEALLGRGDAIEEKKLAQLLKFASELKGTDYRGEMEKFQKENKRGETDFLGRGLSEALIRAGAAASGTGDMGKAFSTFGEEVVAGRNREEARQEKALEQKYKQFSDLLALGGKDRESQVQNAQAMHEALMAQAGKGGSRLGLELGERTEKRKLDTELQKARISHPGPVSLGAQMENYDAAVKKYGEETVNRFLQKGREPRPVSEHVIKAVEGVLASGKMGNKVAVPPDIAARVLAGVANGTVDPDRAMEYAETIYRAQTKQSK